MTETWPRTERLIAHHTRRIESLEKAGAKIVEAGFETNQSFKSVLAYHQVQRAKLELQLKEVKSGSPE